MTTDPLKPIARATVVDAITEQLRTGILSGAFPAGALLPPERALAERFGVNRLTLRAALARLEALGLVQAQHGTGTVVRDFRSHGVLETLPQLLRVRMELLEGTQEGTAEATEAYLTLARDVLELRRIIAAEAVALAAVRHTKEDIEQFQKAVAAQEPRIDDVLAFAEGDLEVARTVVRATRNLGLELLFNTIVRLPSQDPTLARAMYPRPKQQFVHYEVLLGLLLSREPERARVVMREALEAFDRLTLARVAREHKPLPAHAPSSESVLREKKKTKTSPEKTTVPNSKPKKSRR